MALLIIIIYVNILIKIISNENYTNLAILKFKTYNSTTAKEFNSKDFKTFISSNIYLELEVDDETVSKKGVNQILNTFIDSTTNLLSMKRLNLNNICLYNSSLSYTFKVKDLRLHYCKVEEKIKIYKDLNLTKYKYISLDFDNSNCLNDSLCAQAGIDILSHYNEKTDFIYQLHSILNITNQYWTFLFSSKDEGKFIFGDLPHNYIPNEYDEKNLISFYSKTTYYEITIDSIIFEEKNSTIIDFGDNNDYLNIEISPNIEGMIFGHAYFDFIYKYFNYYIKNNICKSEIFDLTTTIIYCDGNKFGIKDIESFPQIIFKKYKFDFNFSFENKELFYYRDSKYFFNIYKRIGESKKFTFGRIFLKKYLTIFNADKKQIYFYKDKEMNNKNDNNEANNNFLKEWWKIIMILFLICLIIFLLIGILIGKILFKNRKQHANELDDYIYQSSNENECLNDSDKGIN